MIMYIVLAGSHPLYTRGETAEQYKAKLKDPQWSFPADFSPLAQSLFVRLVKTNPLERYTANEALAHPWIVRRPCTVPLSYADSVGLEHAKEKLLSVPFMFTPRSLTCFSTSA